MPFTLIVVRGLNIMTKLNIAIVLICVLAGCSATEPSLMRVTGTIEGTTVGVGSRVGGRIAEVAVKEGDAVTQGQLLLKLECSEQEAAVGLAKAKLAQAKATLEKLENGARPEELSQAQAAAAETEAAYMMALRGARSEEIKAARAMADAARAQRDTAQSDFERAKKLFEGKAVSQPVYAQALHRFEAADSQHSAAREQLDLLANGTRNEQIEMAKAARDRAAAALDLVKNGARKEDLEAARAVCAAAEADVLRADTLLKEMTVIAPRNGIIESLDIHAGDLVQPGPAIRITDPEDLKLIVYVSAKLLGELRLGQEVRFTTDSFGAEEFTGKVSYIAPTGEFTPRNLQTEEERVQQMFGVKIAFDSGGGKLRPGMAATAHFVSEPAVK